MAQSPLSEQRERRSSGGINPPSGRGIDAMTPVPIRPLPRE
jgi:hypothetical protein